MTNNWNDIPRLDANFECCKCFFEMVRHVFLGFTLFQQLPLNILNHLYLNSNNIIFVEKHCLACDIAMSMRSSMNTMYILLVSCLLIFHSYKWM
jgi:hypothetical protein